VPIFVFVATVGAMSVLASRSPGDALTIPVGGVDPAWRAAEPLFYACGWLHSVPGEITRKDCNLTTAPPPE
jgi:hypothetical protein